MNEQEKKLFLESLEKAESSRRETAEGNEKKVMDTARIVSHFMASTRNSGGAVALRTTIFAAMMVNSSPMTEIATLALIGLVKVFGPEVLDHFNGEAMQERIVSRAKERVARAVGTPSPN